LCSRFTIPLRSPPVSNALSGPATNIQRIALALCIVVFCLAGCPNGYSQSYGPPKILHGNTLYSFQSSGTDDAGNPIDVYDGGLTVDSSGMLRDSSGFAYGNSYDYTQGGHACPK